LDRPLLFSILGVSDYKHHPEDVIGGALLGISTAIVAQWMVQSHEVRTKRVTAATSTTTLLTLPGPRQQEYRSVDTELDVRLASPIRP